MYITRFIFSFRYRGPMKYLGSIFGGLAITAITYFIVIKGMKGSSFAGVELASGETLQDYFNHNVALILLVSFGFWVVFIQLLKWIFNIKILKVVVMVGTFALAMAFAGNDLVNFIGVPVAGFKSFQDWMASGMPADQFSMANLAGKSSTPVFMLIVSGLVMVITLIMSKKARAVTETELNLSRQDAGDERFGSSLAARVMVRGFTNFNKKVQNTLPPAVSNTLKSRFEKFSYYKDDEEAPAFDKIRASVNLVVASILIALGTSLKLPLSTTYVTFMVAMGTSLSDRAWDRDSAVYRISGVFAVIGGWFLTALIAFSVAGLIALIISLSGKFMIFVFVAVALFMVIRTQILFRKRAQAKVAEEEDNIKEEDETEVIIAKSAKQILKGLDNTTDILEIGMQSFLTEDRSGLRKAEEACKVLSKKAKKNKDKVFKIAEKLMDNSAETTHYYVQMIEHKREMAHAVHYMLSPMIKHVENNHKPFTEDQSVELTATIASVTTILKKISKMVEEQHFEAIDVLIDEIDLVLERLRKNEKQQFKRVKQQLVNTRNSQLYFKIHTELENLLLHSINLVKSERDFITNTRH
jgi:signal transduction histidine kinase